MKTRNEILNQLANMSQDSTNMLYFSSVLLEFNKAMANPDVQLDYLAAVIDKDPGLTAAVLKMANSSFYGLSKKVGTVKQAISILGYKTLEKIFTVNLLNRVLGKPKIDAGEEMWRHSLATAIAAQEIIYLSQPKNAEQIFINGLLHDLGKFVLLNYMPREFTQYQMVMAKNPYQYSVPVETQIFGIDHQTVGAFFAEQWMFPEAVQNCIQYHHMIDNTPKDKDLVAIVAIANNFAKGMELGTSTSKLCELMPRWVWGYLQIKRNDFYNLVPNISQKYKAYLSFLNQM